MSPHGNTRGQTERRIRFGLAAVCVIAAAALAFPVLLPLLERSTAVFVVLAAVWWLAIFAGLAVLTRRAGRRPALEPVDATIDAPRDVDGAAVRE